MFRRVKILMYSTALLLGVAFLGFPLTQTHAATPSQVVIPDFTLEDNHGAAWQLSHHANQPKVFMFWATWCPHCKKLFPTIQSIHERYESAGLEVVAISVFDDGDTQAYAQQRGLTMDVLIHGDALAEGLNVPGTPTVIVLDGNNQVVFGAVNPDPSDTTIELVVQRLLAPVD